MHDDDGRAAVRIWLGQMERRLRAHVTQGDMPFLGLYMEEFSDDIRKYVRERALDTSSPVDHFVADLKIYPATFATYLTVHIVEGYGRSGNAEVYPFVREALGLEEHDLKQQSERERLWSAYRRACVVLGLSVVPKDQSARPLVDEYLRQAGVPLSFLAGLFDSFERQSRRLGIPDVDEPEGLRKWAETVDIPATRPVLRRAVENDEGAYYVQLFLKVRNFDTEADCSSEIERVAFRALPRGPARSTHKALIPEIAWREGDLGVLLPPSENRYWSISIEDSDAGTSVIPPVAGDEDPRFVSLSSNLPKQITVSSGDVRFGFSLWESSADNQLLVFNRTGRLAGRARLGGSELVLVPGTYTLICRWNPGELVGQTYPVSDSPTLYASEVNIAAGKALELKRGPVGLVLKGRSIASLEWKGNCLVGMTGREIYWGPGLALGVSVPVEILESATAGLELVVGFRGGAEESIPVAVGDDQPVAISLGPILERLGVGIDRLIVRLRRPDIPNRSLAAVSGYVWNGLRSATVGRFILESESCLKGLSRDSSDNLCVEGASLTYSDPGQRFFRTVFDLRSGERVAFKWPVPGIFVALEETRDGQPIERALGKGETIQVRYGSRQKLKIYSSSKGLVKLGDYEQELREALLGGTHVYLSTLVEYLTPEHQELRAVFPHSGHVEALVRLVTPHQGLDSKSLRTIDEYVLTLRFAGSVEEIAVQARDLVTGAEDSLYLLQDRIPVTGLLREKAYLLSSAADANTQLEIHFPISNWSDGVWILGLQAKIGGRWGRIINARGDVFAGAMRIPQDARLSVICDNENSEQMVEVFQRLADVALECYSDESWSNLSWVQSEWDRLARALSQHVNKYVQRLLGLALKEPPETAADSWVPVLSVGARLPSIFCLPIEAYHGLALRQGAAGQLLGSGKLEAGDDVDLFRENFLSTLLIMAFSNGSEVARSSSGRLRAFSMARFTENAKLVGPIEHRRIRGSIDWEPSPGVFLGYQHYWWAINKLIARFECTKTGNEFRRGNILRIANRLSISGAAGLHEAFKSSPLSERLSAGLLDPWMDQETKSLDTEFIEHIVDLLSGLAYACRLEARHHGVLDEVMAHLSTAHELTPSRLRVVLGYALYIGTELFVFYLALWEFVLQRDADRAD